MKAVNLIPPEQRRGAGGAYGRSDGAAFVVLGLLAGLVVLALVYAVSSHEISSRRTEAARLTAQAQTAQAQATALAPYSQFLSLRNSRVATVQQLAATRFDWAHAFHELGRVLPADVSLSSVHGSIAGATSGTGAAPAAAATGPATTAGPTGASSSSTPPGTTPTLTISGCTVSQSEVAFMLTRLHLMDGVASVNLNSAAESSPAAGSATTTQSCPVGFQLNVSYQALPPVPTTPTPSTPAVGSASAATPSSPAAAPAAATTGVK